MDSRFDAFGTSHVLMLALFVLLVPVVVLLGRRVRGTDLEERSRRVLAAAIVATAVPLQVLQLLPGRLGLRHLAAAPALRPGVDGGGVRTVDPAALGRRADLLLGSHPDLAGDAHPGAGAGLPAPALHRLLGDAPARGVGGDLPHRRPRHPAHVAPLRDDRRRDGRLGGHDDGVQHRLRQQLRLPQRQARHRLRPRPAGPLALVRRHRGRRRRRGLGADHASVARSSRDLRTTRRRRVGEATTS